VELVRASAHQDPMRPPRGELQAGERRRRDEVGARPADDVRVGRRCRFDELGTGPPNAPQGEVGGVLEDFCR
jgi:hypothetical protein